MAIPIDENGQIPSGLRAKTMRKSMENKNLLQTKGSFYVGTGTSDLDGEDTVFKTMALEGPDSGGADNGKTLIVDSTIQEGWKIDQINTNGIKDNAITTVKIADSNITTDKINNSAVTEAKINNSAVTTDKINNSAVTEAKINNSAVTTDKIGTGAVTEAKIGAGAVTVNKIASGSNIEKKELLAQGTYSSVGDPYTPVTINLSNTITTGDILEAHINIGSSKLKVRFEIDSIGNNCYFSTVTMASILRVSIKKTSATSLELSGLFINDFSNIATTYYGPATVTKIYRINLI